jgi:hypothetical protein
VGAVRNLQAVDGGAGGCSRAGQEIVLLGEDGGLISLCGGGL